MKFSITLCFVLGLVMMAVAHPPRGGPSGRPGRGHRGGDCYKAKKACRIIANGQVVKSKTCSAGACSVDGGSAVGEDGVTYSFTFCNARPTRGEGHRRRHNPCLDDPNVLPPPENYAVLQFCGDPSWYRKACLVKSGSTTLKQHGCPHNGECIEGRGSGFYTYNRQTVTATFCTNCDDRSDTTDSDEP